MNNVSQLDWEEVAQSSELFGVRVVMTAVDSSSIILNLLLMAALSSQSERHPNQRIIVGNISLAALMVSGTHLVKSLIYFVNVNVPMGLVVSTRACVLSEVVKSTAIRTTVFFIMGATIERLVAAFLHATYESRSCLLAAVVLVVTWAQAVLITSLNFGLSSDNVFLPYCLASVAINSTSMAALVGCYSAAEILALLMYLFTIRKAKHLLAAFSHKRVHLSLSSRMQLRHNLDSTVTLLPIVVVHIVCQGILQLYMSLVLYWIPSTFNRKLINMSVADLLASAYFFVHPLALFSCNRSLCARLVNTVPFLFSYWSSDWRLRMTTRRVDKLLRLQTQHDNDANHFEALRVAWSPIRAQQQQKAVGGVLRQATLTMTSTTTTTAIQNTSLPDESTSSASGLTNQSAGLQLHPTTAVAKLRPSSNHSAAKFRPVKSEAQIRPLSVDRKSTSASGGELVEFELQQLQNSRHNVVVPLCSASSTEDQKSAIREYSARKTPSLQYTVQNGRN